MSAGLVFAASLLYLSLAVAVSYTMSKEGIADQFWPKTMRRWGKFLLGMAGLGVVVAVLTALA